MALHAYIPQDRLRALVRGQAMPQHCEGTVLFADIAGFTALTEALTQGQGQRRGVEELTRRINAVHQALIAEIERCGGSVVALAGDGLTCWFDAADGNAARRATLAAQRMQRAVVVFDGLLVKVGAASGSALRIPVGDANIQLIDLLVGETVARAVAAEGLALPGEVLLDAATAAALPNADVMRQRTGSGETCFVLDAGHEAALDDAAAGASGASIALTTSMASTAWPAAATAHIDPALLRPWVLPVVFDRESAGGGLFATELRPATALFIRLRLNATIVADQLATRVAQAQRTVHQHGGMLLEVTVDAHGACLYANFGAAQAHEDDASRALRAALSVLQQLAADGAALQMGLSSGTLCVGGYGGATRRSFGAIGDEVNSAARLMAQAAPGEILVSGRVRQAVGDEFVLEPRPPMPIKGKTEPMRVFAVTGLQQRRSIRLQEPAPVLPMVGRDAQAALLSSRLAQARQGQGQVLRIVAEAGMGKSRLVAEGIRLALRGGFIGYGGGSSSDGVHTPYRAWHAVWTAFFDVDPALPQRRQRQAVQNGLSLHAGEHADAWPLLGAVLGLDWPDNVFTAALQPKDRKALLEAVLLRCLQSAAAEAAEDGLGLLLVLEDLHAADPLSLELLARVARAVPTLPVLLLTSERPAEGDVAALPTLPHAEVVELSGLAADAVEQLVRAKLGALFPERAGAVPRALIERIAARAQGNPFYVEELLDYLHDRGIDPRNADAEQALELPSSLHSLVLSRLDRLLLPLQRELKAASVIGRVFSATNLQGYCPALGSFDVVRADLRELARLGFTPVDETDGDGGSPGAEASHLFKHLVTLEVSYESIAHDTRVLLHGQYARYLEGQHADGLNLLAPLLAHHFERAQWRAEAATWLRRAGEQAAAAFANDEALAYYDRALRWLPTSEVATRFAIGMQREAIHELQGRHDLQRADLAELQTLMPLMQLLPLPPAAQHAQARWQARRAKLELTTGDYAAALAAARAVSAALDAEPGNSSGPSHELRVEALLLESRALIASGQAAAADAPLTQALHLSRAQGHARGEAHTLSQTGLLHWHRSDYAAAHSWLTQALAASRAIGDLRQQLDIHNNLGVVAKSRARHAQAASHYEAALGIARQIGDRSGEAMLLNNLGSALLAAGDFPAAGLHCAQAAQMFAHSQEPVQHAMALINRAEAHREMGQYPAAMALSHEALALLRASGFRRGEAIVLENLGLVEWALGQHAAALRSTEAALALAREIGVRALEASTLHHLGVVHVAAGDHALAHQALTEAAALMQALGAEGAALEVDAAFALLALAQGDAPRAMQQLSRLLPLLLREAAHHAADEQPPPPMALYTAAWRVLRAQGDGRAARLLALAREQLRVRSERIADVASRRDYLAVAEHRVLLEEG